MPDTPRIGDPIEVLMASNVAPYSAWLPATVTYADDSQICAAFSDGERLAISRMSGAPRRWRKA